MIGRCKKIIAQNNFTEGTITDVYGCWWLQINTKPIRTHSLDGAVFPDIISFTYNVNGTFYNGKKFIGINKSGLKRGDKITVYYDKCRPQKYALSNENLM